MSNVKTLETLFASSPPMECLRSFRAKFVLPDIPSLFTTSATILPHSSTMRCSSEKVVDQRSASPSEHKMRNPLSVLGQSFLWVISGSAVIYGGEIFRSRNSSQAEVSRYPGKMLYKILRVNSGGCLNGISPIPRRKLGCALGDDRGKTHISLGPRHLERGDQGCTLAPLGVPR